ncbi:MAG: putative MPP superfamily phosphohydrolase [Verrucomicrobiales bacterium]
MDLTTVLLICAVVAGLSGGMAARYRRWGTALSDIATGVLVTALLMTVSIVILVLAAGLDIFGITHLVYLVIVVGFPIAALWIAIPHLLDADHRTPFLGWVLLICGGVAALLGVWATHVEPFRLQVDTQILGATGATQPVVIGVIADVHATSIGSHELAAIDLVLAEDPDIVVIPGDLFQLDQADIATRIPELLGWLRLLRNEVAHVVLVNGNVDVQDTLADLAVESGSHYLDDVLLELEVGNQAVTIVGMSVDAEREPSSIDPFLLEELQMTKRRNDLVIALSHYPDVVLELTPRSPIDLIISGHTHGGQVALPGIGPVLTSSDVPPEVAAGGLHVVNGHPIYVSTGVGVERGQAPQLRFGASPSVAVITIVPA